MINLNELVATNTEIEQAAEIFSAICLYRDRICAFNESVKLTPSENGTGWFFECKICEGARCTGFLRND